MPVYHVPALLCEAIDGLNIKPNGVYVDTTFGGGGHSKLILDRLGSSGRLFAFDQDIDALNNAIDDSRFTFVHGNFRYINNFLRFHGIAHIDGLIADLGVSSHHFDQPLRGFSFRAQGPLDMRMNKSGATSAQDIINSYSADKLEELFKLYGEIPYSKQLANEICRVRKESLILSTDELVRIAGKFIDAKKEKKELAQIFQALRIEVNGELNALETLLEESKKLIKGGGRIAVISYHSLEDRITKNFFRTGNFDGKIEADIFGHVSVPFKAVNTKPIVPSHDEIEQNPRARSAKLRIAQRTDSY